MKRKIINMRTSLALISAIILLVGLGSAVLIYLTAEDYSDNVLGYEATGGDVYPVTPENSKMYGHDLELFGGKAAVLANEFRHWFIGLWHGKTLAYTIACIAIFMSLGVLYVANHLSSDPISDVRGENNHHGKYFNP